jgi:hypothetical protein
LRRHIPARFIHPVDQAAPGGIPQRVPGGFSASRHAVHGARNRAAVHLEVKAVSQHRGHIRMGHAQSFIHLHG